MVTKDEFLESLDGLSCSLCLEQYDDTHVPVQLPGCGHIFGDYCIANAVEAATQNNNRCPLCRNELFEQEDFDDDGDRLYDADEESEGAEDMEEAHAQEGDEEDEETDDQDDKSEEMGDDASISSDDGDDLSFYGVEYGDSPPPSDYVPSNEEVDSDHEQDDQPWAKPRPEEAKLRPEDGGLPKGAKAHRAEYAGWEVKRDDEA
jgi:hypothetical protein